MVSEIKDFEQRKTKLKNNKDCPPIAIEDNTVPKNDNNVPATNSTSPKFLFFKTDFCLMYK